MVTSSASIAPVLRTHSQVPPITLADYSSQATAQIPSFRNPQIHQTAQREQQWLHSKSTSPGPLTYVNPISPPPPAWAALSTRGAQRALRHRQERREPAGAWKSPSPSPPLAQHLTAPHSSTCPDSKRAVFWFGFYFPPGRKASQRGNVGNLAGPMGACASFHLRENQQQNTGRNQLFPSRKPSGSPSSHSGSILSAPEPPR